MSETPTARRIRLINRLDLTIHEVERLHSHEEDHDDMGVADALTRADSGNLYFSAGS